MVFLWLTILCSTLIYFLFKIRKRVNANLTIAIIINYLTASVLGFALGNEIDTVQSVFTAQWLPIAIAIGLLFVIMFFLIGKSTEKAGITVTSIATRMSMVLPILFSFFLFNEEINTVKAFKILLTFIAVILAIYQKPDKNIKTIYAFLPFILFIGSGSVDTLVKAAQHLYIPENETQLFSSSLFSISLLASFSLLIFNKNNFINLQTILLGVALGAVNFGSLYFLINALNKSGLESSLVFGINNLAIVSLSLILGFFIFKEKLTKMNWIGIALSIICIVLLFQQ